MTKMASTFSNDIIGSLFKNFISGTEKAYPDILSRGHQNKWYFLVGFLQEYLTDVKIEK